MNLMKHRSKTHVAKQRVYVLVGKMSKQVPLGTCRNYYGKRDNSPTETTNLRPLWIGHTFPLGQCWNINPKPLNLNIIRQATKRDPHNEVIPRL